MLRAQAMVDRLADLGVSITWDDVAAIAGSAVVGRPHIARAMVASGAIASPEQAFTQDWIADGGRAYVTRYALDPARAIGLVRAAGGVAVIAHPARTATCSSPTSRSPPGRRGPDRGGGLPSGPACRRASRLLALTRELGLIATGGSDDHGRLTGYRIGSRTTPPAAYEALISRAAAGPGGGFRWRLPVLFPNDHHIIVGQRRSARCFTKISIRVSAPPCSAGSPSPRLSPRCGASPTALRTGGPIPESERRR